MLVGEGLRLGVHGAAVGLLITLALSRFLDSVLYEVAPNDPGVYAGAVATALVMVMVAALIPALDALQIDPARAMRAD